LKCEGRPDDQGPSYGTTKVFFSRIEKLRFPSGVELKHEINELKRRAKTPFRNSQMVDSVFDNVLPGHTCYIYPAITIKNLLPIDLGYRFQSGENGTISPHKTVELYFYPNVLSLKLNLEGFETSTEITLPRDRQITTEARIFDHKRRLLLLTGTRLFVNFS